MAAGGSPFEEGMDDRDLPGWSNESLDDRLNNTDWGGQPKRPNRSSEKNRKKVTSESETRLTNDISPESTPGIRQKKSKTPHTFPHTRYITQMSVPEQAELEKLKQRINFSDLDQRSIGSDSQGRATAANNKRQLNESRKPFNFLSLQINTNKGKDAATSSQTQETGGSSQYKDLFTAALSKDLLQNCPVSIEEDGRGEPAVDSSQIVSRLIQIRDYIAKASSMRDDLVEKNERSANVERLSHLIDHLKEQEKSYLKFLQKMLARDPQQEATEELANLKKQHDLLKRMLQQQEQLKALQGRQAALLALQHKAEQAIAVMDDSVVTETTGSISGVSLTSELNEELNDLIQRFHNQLHDSQVQPVPDNRRQAESLSLTREVSQSRISSGSEHLSEEKAKLFSKMIALQGKKQKMDKLLGELHTLRDQHLNNSSLLPASGSPQRSVDQRSTASVASAPVGIAAAVNEESNSLASSVAYHPDSVTSQNDSEEDDNLNPTEKLQKLNEVRKRLNELRELVHYYEQTSDMMTDAVNENTKEEEETEDSECDSDHENPQPVTNIRNPQGTTNWGEMNCNSNSNLQCGTNNRNGRHLNTSCEINNRSANIRMLNMPSTLDCHYNREDGGADIPQGEDDVDAEADQASEASLSSRRTSIAEEAPADAEFEQKINRLIAAKQKLRQLQNLVAMVQDDEVEPEASGEGNMDQFFVAEEEKAQQQPNNIRTSANKSQKGVVLNEKAREKFYEAKLQQQQRELKHLQEERKKLIKIQEKIQVLQKACPDLQLSSGVDNCPGNTSAPAANEISATNKIVVQPEETATFDTELWSEMRRHEILREELRQRRKQLEALMAEHQRRKDLADTTSACAGSTKSDGSETQCTPQQSRTEKTMATWGGSTQCAFDEDEDGGDEDAYLSDGLGQVEEEEEEEQESSSNEYSVCPNNTDQSAYCAKEDKESWKNPRPLSADGNYRPLAKAKQQQNISMRRQENHRWMSELSHVEEKEQWQEQINQLKKQLEFSVNICQTLMQDQQTLSCLLQTLLTGPYSVLPSNVASPQVHLIMHQLNQCYTQLTWQQNNVQRLKQMLNNLMHQQEQQQTRTTTKEKESRAPPPPSPTMFCPFGFPSQTMNLFSSMPGFTNFSSFPPGINFGPMFPSGLGDFPHNCTAQNSEHQQQPIEPNTSGKMDYMAFPKPFGSNSTGGVEKPRGQLQPEEETENRSTRSNGHQEGGKEKHLFLKSGFAIPVQNAGCGNHKNQAGTSRRREFDEESLESFSSMPDPVDPTTVTKTFKPRKASAQASLASKDKTPKSKNKRRNASQFRNRSRANGFESASVSSTGEPYKSNRSRHSTRKEEVVQAKVFSKKNREQLEKIIKYSRSSEMSSAHARRILQQSNRNACIEAPETGSDLSMFEALRDTIYSEVATLISQNESRPHFLIELFHELQMLNSDYLRQRALYALQDIVTRHASEENAKGECPKPLNSAGWAESNSEHTPSESLATTDDERFEKNFDEGACRECEQHDADNGSTMSTSSNFEPFATDELGNTVIHLEQALARMREYGRKKMAVESNVDSEDGCCSNPHNASASKLEGSDTAESHCAAQSAEVPAVPCPRIDTQQLDRQIKAIMKEVIPFLREHMDEVCSSQLLTSVRRMVLTLTQQNDESKEFVKIFHKQLRSILQDSLAKFAGKKLKDCGEDLLVEISEVLFNELAFFKLMQDLDNNSPTVKQRGKRKMEADGMVQSYAKEAKRALEGGACSSNEDIDEDRDKDETETIKQVHEPAIFNNREVPRSTRSDASDQEEEESENCPVSISLSKAETQALTNYGSGEDENEDEEIDEFEGPVDVQTSLQANNETAAENEQEQILQPKPESPNGCQMLPTEDKSGTDNGDQDLPASVPQYLNVLEDKQPSAARGAEDLNASAALTSEEPDSSLAVNESQALDTLHGETKSSSGTPESSVVGSPNTESPVLVNEYETGSGNVSQKSDEDDFVKVENLPLKLAVYSEEELMKNMVAEAQSNSITEEILSGAESHGEELVGDPQMLKEPETTGAQSA
ncbi:pericentriolar material 1 protein isoform X6 [Zootoca vivipara]|uniref:pericentriolar material 1 protein isoform X6 n=1 Tax=Zootoca vivipara TaxID=8524 RepID=UPI00293BEE15|nr:pericentriolar material 1 protein isoform X6 [Zootoca vivipara]